MKRGRAKQCNEYTDYTLKGRLDTSGVNKRRLEEFMKQNGLKI